MSSDGDLETFEYGWLRRFWYSKVFDVALHLVQQRDLLVNRRGGFLERREQCLDLFLHVGDRGRATMRRMLLRGEIVDEMVLVHR